MISRQLNVKSGARLTISIQRCGEGCKHSNTADAFEPANTLPNAQVIKLGPHKKSFACVLDGFGVSFCLLHFGIGVDADLDMMQLRSWFRSIFMENNWRNKVVFLINSFPTERGAPDLSAPGLAPF